MPTVRREEPLRNLRKSQVADILIESLQDVISCVAPLNVCDHLCVRLWWGKGRTHWKEVHLAVHPYPIKLKQPLDCTLAWTLNNMCCTFCELWNVQTIWVLSPGRIHLPWWCESIIHLSQESPCRGTLFSMWFSSVNWVYLINTQPFDCWYSWALSGV